VAAVAGLIFYWDAIVAAFKDSSWGQVLIKIFDSVMSVFSALIDNVTWVLEALGLMDGKDMTINSKVEEVTKTAAPMSAENTLSTKLNTETLGSNHLANMNTRINQANGFTPVAANQVLNTEALATSNLVNTNTRLNQVNSFAPVAANQVLNSEALATNHLANTNTQFNQVSGLSPVATSLVESQTFNETSAHSARIQQYQENNQQLATVSRPRIQRTQYFQQSKQSASNKSNSSADNSKRVYIDNVVMKSDNLAHDFEQLMELAG